MIRRFMLVVLLAFALVAALPAATSANHGEAHGGGTCIEAGCWGTGSGGNDQASGGGGGGRLDYSWSSNAGGGGYGGTDQGGGSGWGGRYCDTDQCEVGNYKGGGGN